MKGPITDPKRPKRPLNAFFLYFLDIRPRLAKMHPSWTLVDFAREAGMLWKEESTKLRKKYLKRADLGRRKYRYRMSRYHPPSRDVLFRKFGVYPKRFTSNYGYYLKRNFSLVMRRRPKMSFTELVRYLARMWKVMTAKQKLPYQINFELDYARWQDEMHKYKEGYLCYGVDKGHVGCKCDATWTRAAKFLGEEGKRT